MPQFWFLFVVLQQFCGAERFCFLKKTLLTFISCQASSFFLATKQHILTSSSHSVSQLKVGQNVTVPIKINRRTGDTAATDRGQ